MSACKKVSSRQALDKIHELETQAEAKQRTPNRGMDKSGRDLLAQLGGAYADFAKSYPDAPETPEFLFRAGELYSNELQDFPKAIEMFKQNFERYPEHETAGNALFFVAYLYNNSLHDLIQAEKYYEEFLAKYPAHKMVQSAKFELKNLGKSVDDLFQQIAKGDSAQGADSLLP
jgi:tetratricopeptide (TPR) repeat protein